MGMPRQNETTSSHPDPLTGKTVLRFWSPLALTWLMMAFEGPYLSGVIARLAEPKVNLAAFGVALAFAMLIESPIIMMLSASTALIRDSESYRKLRNFMLAFNLSISLILVITVIPPVFRWITIDLMGLPEEVSNLARQALVLFFPWPAAIGFRRFYQGILIKAGLTRRVALGTLVRMGTITVTALIFYFLGHLPGALIGALSLSIGVVAEALATRLMARRVVRDFTGGTRPPVTDAPRLRYREIAHFYFPLVLTSLLNLGINPIVTFFLGSSQFALESLAVYPVINSLVFLFRSISLSYQEVAIALLGDHLQEYPLLRRYAFGGAILLGGGLAVIAWSPLSPLWFRDVSGLSSELAALTSLPLKILVFVPFLSLLLSFQRAVLILTRRTATVTQGTIGEVLSLICVLILTIRGFDLVGIQGAALALLVGQVIANALLVRTVRGVVSRNHSQHHVPPPGSQPAIPSLG
jgi:progressive ankylosis protein